MTPPHFYIFVIISPLKNWPFIWINLNSSCLRIICSKFYWIWPCGSGENLRKTTSVYFYPFAIISPWRRVSAFIWINFNPLSPRMMFDVWLKFAQKFLRSRFSNDPTPFLHVCDYLTWPFIWANFNSLHTRIICIKFDWNWLNGSWEEDCYIFLCIFTLLLLSPLRKGRRPSFEKPMDDLCQVLLKLAHWFWRSQKCKRQTDGRTTDHRRSE
jgi:hypothetical protein